MPREGRDLLTGAYLGPNPPQHDHPLPSYSVVAADTLRDLVTLSFDLLTLVMAGHVINPYTKFEDPTAIRS